MALPRPYTDKHQEVLVCTVVNDTFCVAHGYISIEVLVGRGIIRNAYRVDVGIIVAVAILSYY